MTTPNKTELYSKAVELWIKDQHRNGSSELANTNPEYNELLESGYIHTARSFLMRANPYAIEIKSKSDKPRKQPTATPQPVLHHKDFYDMLDLEECKASNILISGTNRTGKSRLACAVASVLQSLNWRVICFDNSGVWKSISDIPNILELKPNKPSCNIPSDYSLIVDMSNLTSDHQKILLDSIASDIWINRKIYGDNWLLVILEELELYAKNLRGTNSQNLKRLMHAGRNRQVRVLGVTTDLSLIDCSFIRLCQQRFHGRLGIEANSKRRFKQYYGKQWLEVATKLKTGHFIYLLRDQLSLISVPLFTAKRKPQTLNHNDGLSWFEKWIYRSG